MSRRPLTRNVAANVINAAVSIASAALAVPLALHYVGLDGYGTWTLAQTALIYVATAETGFGPAVQRYVSVAHGAGDARGAARVIWSAGLFYLALGAAISLTGILAAPALTSLFGVPAPLHADAVAMFRVTGVAMLPALVASGLAGVLQGVERFREAALATAASAVVFLAVAAALLAAGRGLLGLAEAALAQFIAGVLLRIWMLRDVLAAGRPGLVSRAEARGLAAFSARMQVNVVSTLVNSQTDKLVVGLIATTAAVGEVAIGSQVAEATRFLAGAALGPVIARLAIAHGEGDPGALTRLYHRLDGLWQRLTVGLTVVAMAAMSPLISAWLGDDTGRAALYGVVLTFAYGVNLLTGTSVAYLRAIGTPGLEARYGMLVIGANVVLTIALGVLFGPVGVVSATAAAYAAGTWWFFARLHRVAPPGPRAEGPSRPAVAGAALLAGGFTVTWGLVMTAWLPRAVALVAVGLGAAAALTAYALAATGTRPSVRGLRSLLVPGGVTR